MRLAISAQGRPARNVLTVAVSCVNPTRKPVADASRFSVRPAFSFIGRSTRSQRMGNVESEKEPSRTAASAGKPLKRCTQPYNKVLSHLARC